MLAGTWQHTPPPPAHPLTPLPPVQARIKLLEGDWKGYVGYVVDVCCGRHHIRLVVSSTSPLRWCHVPHSHLRTKHRTACCLCTQAGPDLWVQLTPWNHVLVTSVFRECGTPGCTLRDFHNGACITELRSRPRRSILAPPKIQHRSLPLLSQTFQWASLDLDLRAMVLSHLAKDVIEFQHHLANLARHLRPLRPVIVRTLFLDARMRAVIDRGWFAMASTSTLQTSGLHCNWRNAYTRGARKRKLQERVMVGLRLHQQDEAPRRWQWKLHLDWHIATLVNGCRRVAMYKASLKSTTRMGVLPSRGQIRRHRVSAGTGAVCVATQGAMEQYGVCYRRRGFERLDGLQVSTVGPSLHLMLDGELLVEWMLPLEAHRLMQLIEVLL